MIRKIGDIDQQGFDIGEQHLGWKLRLHLRFASQNDVFVEQSLRERLVVSDVDFFVAVGNADVSDRAQQVFSSFDVFDCVLIVEIERCEIGRKDIRVVGINRFSSSLKNPWFFFF